MNLDAQMRAELVEAHERAVIRCSSPWLTRADAAAYCGCSTSEIDRAANAGVFKRYLRALTPLFKKAEIDAAIEKGAWLGRKADNASRTGEQEAAA
jgi:hypothetical protein